MTDYLRGLDASSVQGNLPFAQMPWCRFVVLKAQQGNDGFDPFFAPNMKAALAHCVEPFAYCFAYPLPHLDPIEQARHFVEQVHRFPAMIGRPIFLDLEWPAPEEWVKWHCTGAQIADFCKALCAEVAAQSGRTPVLYTYPYWWRQVAAQGGSVEWAGEYPLWIASYGPKGWPDKVAKPVVPPPWADWLFWQFDGNGGLKLPNGVDADFCVFKGGEEDLAALVRGDASPDEVPTVPDFQVVFAVPDTTPPEEK